MPMPYRSSSNPIGAGNRKVWSVSTGANCPLFGRDGRLCVGFYGTAISNVCCASIQRGITLSDGSSRFVEGRGQVSG